MLNNFTRELELSDRLETQYLRVLYYDLPRNYTDDYHSYEYTRLCTIVEGLKHISVNQSDNFDYDPGQFLLLPPRSTVQMKIDCPTRAVVFELSDALLQDVCEHVSLADDIDYDLLIQDNVLCAKGSAPFSDVYRHILSLLTSGDRNIKYMLDLLGQQLVYHLIQTKGARQLLDLEPDNPVNRAIRYMRGNHAEAVSIRDIAGDLGLSEANFCQRFKKVTGQSPGEYLTHIRMEHAREHLIHTSVTDAAMDAGYENISHFIAQFKACYGITPGKYKKQLKKI